MDAPWLQAQLHHEVSMQISQDRALKGLCHPPLHMTMTCNAAHALWNASICATCPLLQGASVVTPTIKHNQATSNAARSTSSQLHLFLVCSPSTSSARHHQPQLDIR
jgi:hypothetical protein